MTSDFQQLGQGSLLEAIVWTRAKASNNDPWIQAISELRVVGADGSFTTIDRIYLPLVEYIFVNDAREEVLRRSRSVTSNVWIFTSPRAVESLCINRGDLPEFSSHDRIILAGEGCQTAWLQLANSICPLTECICLPARRRSVIAHLEANPISFKSAIYLCSRQAPNELDDYFASRMSISYERIEIYDTVRKDLDENLVIVDTLVDRYLSREASVTAVIMSASTASAWHHLISNSIQRTKRFLSSVHLVSIGPETSERLRSVGLRVGAEARSPTTYGLIEALQRFGS